MDQKVLETQQWLNKTYGYLVDFDKAPENGNTGWPTITSLIEALQYELGIPSLTGEFGPATLAACPELKMGYYDEASNIIKILQGGMWCKGYDCDDLTGRFLNRTHKGICLLQSHIGIKADGIVTAHLFKSILNMDAFVLVSSGNDFIRGFQQHFNNTYVAHNDGNYIPCDGRGSRETTNAVAYAVQDLEGYSYAESTGFFGDNTAANFPHLTNGISSPFVYPLQVALTLNGYYVGDISNTMNTTIEESIKAFQGFMALSVNGIADGKLMKNLLISTGDATRDVDGCDSAMPLDQNRINSLKYYNYKYVGRYITPGEFSWGNKQLTIPEINLILNNGLRIFPIYQTSADYANYFTYEKGNDDAIKSLEYCKNLMIPESTIIYFAVDYDFMDGELYNSVIPYFEAISEIFNGASNKNNKHYRIGVYSSRNTCKKVQHLVTASFVSGMSTGYSGNQGFSMPNNWSFNQILGVDFLSIDNDAVSGLDKGFGKEEYENTVNITDSINNSFFNQLKTVYETAIDYTKGDIKKSNKLTAMYFRHTAYNGSNWSFTAGTIDNQFCDIVNQKLNYQNIIEYYDVNNGFSVGIKHLMASLNALLHDILDIEWIPYSHEVAQFADWAGDLTTLAIDIKNGKADKYSELSLNEIGSLLMANPVEYKSSFSLTDYMGDLDAYNIYKIIKNNTESIYNATKSYYTSTSGNCSQKRTISFINNEYNGSINNCQVDIITAMTSNAFEYTILRKMLLKEEGTGEALESRYFEAAANSMIKFVLNEYNNGR